MTAMVWVAAMPFQVRPVVQCCAIHLGPAAHDLQPNEASSHLALLGSVSCGGKICYAQQAAHFHGRFVLLASYLLYDCITAAAGR